MAVMGGRLGMATGLVRFRNRPVPDERLLAMSPAELHALSATLIRSWHPDLRALHAMADIEETFVVRIRRGRRRHHHGHQPVREPDA